MGILAEKLLAAISKQPGITDRWLAEALFGPGTPQQRVNGECRHLAGIGRISRKPRPDGLLGNFPAVIGIAQEIDPPQVPIPPAIVVIDEPIFSEDEIKRTIETWLHAKDWSVEIAWARTRGIDIHARRNDERWIIEVKGQGSLNPMRVNYFLGVLGETLQRMDDPTAKYSIALPDIKQFRNLWGRLPQLAKERTQISALFVKQDGSVDHVGAVYGLVEDSQ